MLSILAAVALVPPPPPGDHRTEILYAVRSLVDALTTGDRAKVASLLEAEGSFVAVDSRDPANLRKNVRSFAQILSNVRPDTATSVERLGIPTLVQRDQIAQVWVPYAFEVDGKLTHCGMDAFSLVRRGAEWRVSGLVYSIEPVSACAELAAPVSTRP